MPIPAELRPSQVPALITAAESAQFDDPFDELPMDTVDFENMKLHASEAAGEETDALLEDLDDPFADLDLDNFADAE